MAVLYRVSLDDLIDFDIDMKEIEQAIEKSSVEKDEQVDWTKAWGKKYPILLKYQSEVNIPNYGMRLREMLDELKASMKEKGLTLSYDDELVKYLVKKSYSAAYGARNLRRTIQKEVEDQLALTIINSYDHPATHLSATAEEEKVVIRAL